MHLLVYAPPLTVGDDRPLKLVEAIEDSCPGDSLVYSIAATGDLVRIEDRVALLREAAARGELATLCNGREGQLVRVAGHLIPAVLGPGGTALLQLGIVLPPTRDYAEHAAELLLRVSEAARVFWGVALPNTATEIGAQTIFPWIPAQPPLGLPALSPPQHLTSPLVPQRLGWINYWSEPTAKLMGFLDPTRDAELLSRSRRGREGGWLIKLTDAPLDLSKASDLNVLKDTYERFPHIGGRVPLPNPT